MKQFKHVRSILEKNGIKMPTRDHILSLYERYYEGVVFGYLHRCADYECKVTCMSKHGNNLDNTICSTLHKILEPSLHTPPQKQVQVCDNLQQYETANAYDLMKNMTTSFADEVVLKLSSTSQLSIEKQESDSVKILSGKGISEALKQSYFEFYDKEDLHNMINYVLNAHKILLKSDKEGPIFGIQMSRLYGEYRMFITSIFKLPDRCILMRYITIIAKVRTDEDRSVLKFHEENRQLKEENLQTKKKLGMCKVFVLGMCLVLGMYVVNCIIIID